MTSELQRWVGDALRVLGVVPRAVAVGTLEVNLPASLRRHFRDRGHMRLVFDEDRWRHDKEAELVAVGSPFLAGLESALRELGLVTYLVGGEWFPDPKWFMEWKDRHQVQNGRDAGHRDVVRTVTAVRILYEVTVPGSVERTELVPLVWHEREGVLPPNEVATLLNRPWYSPAEAGLPDEPLGSILLEDARSACVRELQRRIIPALEDETAPQRGKLEQERLRLLYEAEARRREAKDDKRLDEIEEELAQRLQRIERARAATFRVVEQVVAVLRIASCEPIIDFARTLDGKIVAVTLTRNRAGRFRTDLCSGCTESHTTYLLAPGQKTALLCTSCGGSCAAADCPEVVLLGVPPTCRKCAYPAYCSAHVRPCRDCGQEACETHGARASCCGTWLCDEHIPRHQRADGVVCSKHGDTCTVDGLWTSRDELLTCPVTGLLLFPGNAEAADGDVRQLHPSAIVTCCATGQRVATDRAAVCAVDGRWYRADHLEVVDGERVCEHHLTEVDVPPARRVRSDGVLLCTQTSAKLAPEAAGVCTVRDKVYERRWLVECPITGNLLHHEEAVQPPGDARALHPSAVVRCAETGIWVARDRAVADEFAGNGAWLAPEASFRCQLSGKWTAISRVAVANCCERTVAMPYTGRSPISGKLWCRDHGKLCAVHGELVLPDETVVCQVSGRALCVEHAVVTECGRWVDRSLVQTCSQTGDRLAPDRAGRCSVDDRVYRRDLLIQCPLTGLVLRPEAAITPPEDGRSLHPSAVVRCSDTGKWVAKDRAVLDELSEQGPGESWLAPSSAVRCAVSGKWTSFSNIADPACCHRAVATQFTGRSTISGQSWCRDHGTLCAAHGELVLPEEAVACQVTGRALCVEHAVVTECGRWVDRSLVQVCSQTGDQLAPDRAARCSVRDRVYRRDLLIQCPLTSLILHPDAAIVPPDDGRRLHPSAVVRSSETGVWLARDRAVLDELSARASGDSWLEASAAVRCAVSGKWTSSTNIAVPACCHRTVATQFTGRSPISARIWCRDHGRRCEAHGALVLPDEAVHCAITGRPLCIEHTIMAECGRRVAAELVQTCSETGAKLAPDRAERCSVTGRVYAQRLVVRCPITGLWLHPSVAIREPDSGRLLHPTALVQCAFSGVRLARDRAVRDELAVGEEWLSPDAAVRCAISQKWTAPTRVVTVRCCKRTVSKALAGRSPISGRYWCRDHARRCEAHNDHVLPEEAVVCAISGRQLCIQHAVTTECGRWVGMDRVLELEDGQWGCPDHYVRCTAGHAARRADSTTCVECGAQRCGAHVGHDEYEPALPRCSDHLRECRRCRARATHRDSDTCLWCEDAARIKPGDPQWAIFLTSVRPGLGWSTALLWQEVRCSGTDTILVFQVTGPFGSEWFRVVEDTVETLRGGTWTLR